MAFTWKLGPRLVKELMRLTGPRLTIFGIHWMVYGLKHCINWLFEVLSLTLNEKQTESLKSPLQND